MKRAGEVVRQGDWSGPTVDSVDLDYGARSKRRMTLNCVNGTTALLDLPRPSEIADGDALRLEDGGLIAVRAAPEDLLRVTCDGAHALARIAWHIGNRHLPAEISGDWILIRYDHVIEKMLVGLGARTKRVSRPFQPEGGAYSHHGGHSHGDVAHG